MRTLNPFALSLSFFASAASAQFTPGRLAVLECSSGGSSGTPYTIREFDTNGVPGVVINVPTTGPNAAVGVPNTTYASQLSRTPSGDALIFPGFAAMAPTGTPLTSTSSSSIPRVICRVDAAGNIVRVASTNTYCSGSTMFGAASDGTHYWGSGGVDGVVYLGPGTPAVINNATPVITTIGLSAGALYGTNGSSVFHLGAGAPTTPTPRTFDFTGLFWGAQDVFVFPDGNTAYTSNFNRVEKWERVAGTWTHAYDLLCNTSGGGGAWLVRITVDLSGPQPVIYGVHNIPTKLVKWVDNGPGSPEQLLYQPAGIPRWYGIAFTPGSPCPTLGQPCDDNDPTTGNDEVRSDCVCRGDRVQLAAMAFLEGPFDTVSGTMSDALRPLTDFPQTEPYSALGLMPTSGDDAVLGSGVLSVIGTDAVVDWILLELRDPVTPATVLHRVPALLQRDGDIVALDGSSAVRFPAAPGPYHIAVRHRNHLGIMTAIAALLSDAPIALDFTDPSFPVHGTDGRQVIGNIAVLWQGDTGRDGTIKYTGTANDRDPVLVAIGGNVPTNTIAGYFGVDTNMDGIVKYTGTANDRDPILLTIGGGSPTNVRSEQLPQ